mmetsp:Transcript_16138/g.56290  ORF Transcript_16138/g.56290 Transcript_16138/m.56290 type:complete len:2677 (-) Transcript_16138:165-8195(-)
MAATSGAAPREASEAMVDLRDVVLAAAVDRLPEEAVHWPVRVVRASDLKESDRNVYLCGSASSVARLRAAGGALAGKALMGVLVGEEGALSGADVGCAAIEVLEALKNGFSKAAWEAVVAAVCSKHVATIQHMILRHARQTPHKTAIIFEDNEWTYQQFCSMANSLTVQLKAIGVHPNGGNLAVQMVQTDLTCVVYLGLHAARYTFQIVDATAAGRAFRLEACPCQAFLTLAGIDPEPSMKTIFVDELTLDTTTPVTDLRFEGELEDVAFIEYTSGSTGRPKSVATLQGRISHWVRWRQFHFPLLEGNDRVAYNLFFIWYWFITLCQGGIMVVTPVRLNHDISALMKYLDKHKVNRCDCLTPGLIAALLDVESTLPPSLKTVISGGEALPLSTCRDWLKRWPHVELMNNYALTEAAADIGFCLINEKVANMELLYVPITDGIIAWNNKLEIVDEELVISGWNIADGYLPPTVSTSFELDKSGGQRSFTHNRYRTGDRAKMVDGKVVLSGRVDSVVKIRGHRVDLTGLEAIVGACEAAKDLVMVAWKDSVWCVVVTEDLDAIKRFAEKEVPQAELIVWRAWPELPYSKSGKRDRKMVLKMLEESKEDEGENEDSLPGGRPITEGEHKVADAWKAVLGRAVGRTEPFQQAGGHSLAAMRVAKALGISPAEVFAYPTIASMAAYIHDLAAGPSTTAPVAVQRTTMDSGAEIAVVGMAARLPGAPSVAAFWEALEAGRDLLTDLPCSGDYVPRKGTVPDLGFDCAFWGLPKEAATLMDTAQRTLLELSHEALEDAGLDPFNVKGRVGVVVCGGSLPHYATDRLGINLEECRRERPDEYFALEIGTDKDYLSTQISFRLNLHGPSENIGTACSSGLVTIVRAVQMLRLGLCDYVLCGGASFSPDDAFRKVDGMIWSADGVCRPFAQGANGTVHSDGAGIIVLTRLEAAETRGERVYATVRGAFTNNDGARKAGYSAPSMEGQVEVIQAALADAGLVGADVDYIEAHGTGTKMGDPLEVHALTKALAAGNKEVALGSVKGNLGHLNTAAGVPGFMKAALMLFHQRKVPSLHAKHPSQLIDWDKTPLRLVESGGEWKGSVAGVTSLGIGGTNAHVVLGAPPTKSTQGFRPVRAWQREILTPPRSSGPKASAAAARQSAVPAKPAGGITNMFYDTRLVRTEVSCLELKEAAIIADGDVLPADLPANWVVTSLDRAIPSARACGGNLVFVGAAETKPTMDDTTQEDLLWRVTSLLTSLTRASRDGIEVFFVLSPGTRYAGLWGLLRVAAREHPELKIRRLLRHEGAPLIFPAMPTELVLKSDGAYASRLHLTSPPPVPPSGLPVYKKALITGGLRGLGVKVAEWLFESGRAASLVLVGRSEARGEAAQALELLRKKVPVKVVHCDVAEWAEVQRLPDCDLVVHCAGAVKDGLLMNLSKEDAQKVYRPKIRGALHLKERFANAKIVAFSSSSGLFGVAGQSTYAAANTFMDSILPGVQWGGWGETGMVTELGVEALPGERFMPVAQGLECLGRFLDSDEEKQLCVVDVDWDVFRKNNTVFAPDEPLLADIEVPAAPPSLLGTPRGLGDDSHALGWELVLGPVGARWRGSSSSWEVCQQHVVGGTPIFPATAFVALAVEAARHALGTARLALSDIAFLRPLELSGSRRITTMMLRNGNGGTLRFSSRPAEEHSAPILHCTCSFAPAASDGRLSCSLPSGLPAVDGLYDRFAAAGFHYGPAFRVSNVSCDGSRAYCDLREQPGSPFIIHPAMLDSALHLASLLHPLGCRGVPQGIRRLTVGAGMGAASACASCEDGGEVNTHVLDRSGGVFCSVEGLRLSSLDAPATLKARRRVLREHPEVPRHGTWLASGKEAVEMGLPKTTTKSEEPHDAIVLAVAANSLADVGRCREEARRASALVPCWVMCKPARFADAAAAAAIEVGAHAVVGAADDICSFAENLGGNVNFIRVEEDGLTTRALEPAEEPRQVWASTTEPYKVTMDPARAAKGVQCRRSNRRSPAPHEVELLTSLWALNFRDVLVAVGAISTEVAGQSLGLGGECYGEVVSVGSEVKGLSVGDKVIAVPPDGMGTYLTVDARWVARSPDMSPEEAVSGTCVYATAWLGLKWMARIAKGDRVLIHSAAGGVGLAAVHLCLRQGCIVYATASTPEKRELLLSLGVTAVFNSRNVANFEEGVQAATGGDGVDIVLNSLSGEAIPASLRLLRPFGRFIEFGKRDQYEDTRLGLAPFLSGLTYSAAHFDVLMLRQPDRCRQLLEEVWRDLPDLPRLPTKTFQISEMSNALEYFSKGIHVGKVLVGMDDTPVLPARPTAVSGPAGCLVTQALRAALGATSAKGGVVCVPDLGALMALGEGDLQGAQVVISASPAVIAIAEVVCPEAIRVELPRWEPIASIDEWLALGGHIVTVEEEQGGDLREWLLEVVTEMAGSIDMDATFESAGLDSLSLISLARRLSAKTGKSVSVADLYDNPTPQRLLDAFGGRPQPQLLRPKALCLHGFRSNKDAMAMQMAHMVSAFGSVEWVFVNASRRASGPAATKIPQGEAVEWWGQREGSFETGWLESASQYDGLDETLPLISAMNPVGIVGFSQGGGVAALLEARWLVFFSAVRPRGLRRRDVPSLHCWDPTEDYVEQFVEVSEHFTNKEVLSHSEGHTVPHDPSVVAKFVSFVSANMP